MPPAFALRLYPYGYIILMMSSSPDTPMPDAVRTLVVDPAGPALERRGRSWLLGSFLFCPCHLPLSLGVLTAVFAGTSLGAVLRDHAWVAGTLITLTWVLGTGYGFRLLRQAQRAGGACPVSRR